MSTPLLPCSELQRRLSAPDGAAWLAATYGDAPALLQERRQAWLAVLRRFDEAFGDMPVGLYRAPSRISLNPHSDHQGAWVPYGTHARELVCACAPDDGGEFAIVNTDPVFASPLRFRLDEEIGRAPAAWERSWREYIEDPAVVSARLELVDPPGASAGLRSPAMYVEAAALRLRRERPDLPVPGLRMALHGNIPRGSGLSSSSAVVVVTASALNELTGAGHPRRALAELCGDAEWFVGTRGGSGDHAAMLLGHRAGLTHLCFWPPFGIRGILHSVFPAGHQLVLANSGRRSEKSGSERLFFNRGVFAYRFAFLALQDALRELAGTAAVDPETLEGITCLGDLQSERVPLSLIYEMLLRLPERISPADLRRRYPQRFAAAAVSCFGTADPAALPQDVPLRGAAMYGLGRVDRGLVMPGLLARRDRVGVAEFGRLMSITHDGDRVTRWRDGCQEPYHEHEERLSDAALTQLRAAAAAGRGQPGWDAAQLRRQPGFYGASIPELDRLVDAALSVDAVRGAGLMGAGGGGCVLILVEDEGDALAALRRELDRQYYTPLAIEPQVERWHPVDAAGPLPVPGG